MIAGGPDLSLRRMLSARSVAVVGASARPGSVGERCLVELRKGGYAGRVVPVNPKYERLGELRCVPRIAEAGPVDVAVLAVPNALLEEQLAAAIAAGAGSAVVFASAHEEPDEGRPPLADRLGALARGAGIPICGPNGMGFLNVEEGLRICGFSQPAGIRRGGLAFVSHSGSAFSALLHNDRGLGFNLVVSSGLEVTTTAADYLRHALALPSTRVAALFLEVVRDPIGFRDALAQAAQADIPVVVLKVGREARTRELVRAHSGALAGEDGAYEALFDAYGVARVESLDELADTCELLLAGRRAGPGALATAHDSGGERAMLADAATREQVPLATLGETTRERLAALLDPGLTPENPLDLWGTGRETEERIPACLGALADDPAVAAVAFAVDLTTEEDPSMGYTAAAIAAAGATRKPFAVLANFAGGIDRRDASAVRRAGVPVLEGTRTGLAAFRHLFARRDARALPPVAGSSPLPEAKRARWHAATSAASSSASPTRTACGPPTPDSRGSGPSSPSRGWRPPASRSRSGSRATRRSARSSSSRPAACSSRRSATAVSRSRRSTGGAPRASSTASRSGPSSTGRAARPATSRRSSARSSGSPGSPRTSAISSRGST